MDLGSELESAFAIMRDRIALAHGHGDIRIIDFNGVSLFTTFFQEGQVDNFAQLEFSPSGELWIQGKMGDLAVPPDGKPIRQTKLRSGLFFSTVSRYAGPGKRWVTQRNGTDLLLASEDGSERRMVARHRNKSHVIEAFDSGPDGSLAALCAEWPESHFVEIYRNDGTLEGRFTLPRWKEWHVLPMSYDGRRVLLQREEGCYCFSRTGKRLWFYPTVTSSGNSKLHWIGKDARLVDGGDELAIKDMGGSLRDMMLRKDSYKIRLYSLPAAP